MCLGLLAGAFFQLPEVLFLMSFWCLVSAVQSKAFQSYTCVCLPKHGRANCSLLMKSYEWKKKARIVAQGVIRKGHLWVEGGGRCQKSASFGLGKTPAV